jgi:signal transduction histidine kinase
MREYKFAAIYVGLVIVILVWGTSISGFVFNELDFGAYDFFTRLNGTSVPFRSDCLLLGADYSDAVADDNVWLAALDRLEAMGAGQIVFTFMPSGVSPEFYKRAEQINGVYFGRQRVKSGSIQEKLAFEPIPVQARSESLKIGLQEIPPGSFGIRRFMQTYWEFSGQKHNHVILEAAQDRIGSRRGVDQFILVNFMGGAVGIPSVDLKTLLSGDVITEMVAGKTVLVGFQVPPYFPDLRTPLTPGRPGMSPLQFYAYAFETLVSNKYIKCAGTWTTLALVILAVIISIIAYQMLTPLKSVVFAMIMAAISVTASWLLLRFFLIWIPLVEISTAGVLSLIAAIAIRARYQYLDGLKMLLGKSGRSQSRYIPERFFRSDEHWMQIANMVNQTLRLKRSIFFEKIEGQRRVKVIVSLNTSLSDIGERRRDFSRNPYATAITQRGPIKVNRFFKSASEDEDQFIAPLTFSGLVLGIWAFTIERNANSEDSVALEAAEKFALQIGELLYRRRAWLEEETMRRYPLRQFLSLRAGQRQSEQLADFIDMQELRLSLLESTFDSLRSPALLADIFGRVLLVNEPMSALGKFVKTDLYQMTALDVVASFSERDPNEIRTSLSKVILSNKVVEFPVSISMDRLDMFYNLSVRSVRSHDKGLFMESGLPFSLHGLLIQMRDVSDPVDLMSVKERLIEQGMPHIRKRVDALVNACTLIGDPAEITGDRNQILANLVNRKTALEASLDELQSFIGVQGSAESIKYFPIDAGTLVDRARFSLRNEAEEKHLTFKIEGTETSWLVLAAPKELVEIFSIILSILIKDAAEGSILLIIISEDDGQVSFSFSNSGYGMRNQDLKAYIDQGLQDPSEDFDRLRFLKTRLEQWHGTLEYQSKIGHGIIFTITLIKSIIS